MFVCLYLHIFHAIVSGWLLCLFAFNIKYGARCWSHANVRVKKEDATNGQDRS